MTAHPVRPHGGAGRARRIAAAALLAGAIALVSLPTPTGAAPDQAIIGPISVPSIALTPLITVPVLGVNLGVAARIEVPSVDLPALGTVGSPAAGASAPPQAGGSTASAAVASPAAGVSAIDARTAAGAAIDRGAAPTGPPISAQLPAPNAETAVLRRVRSSTALFVLLAAAIAFLVVTVVQGRGDRGTGLLAAPALDRREDVLEFP